MCLAEGSGPPHPAKRVRLHCLPGTARLPAAALGRSLPTPAAHLTRSVALLGGLCLHPGLRSQPACPSEMGLLPATGGKDQPCHHHLPRGRHKGGPLSAKASCLCKGMGGRGLLSPTHSHQSVLKLVSDYRVFVARAGQGGAVLATGKAFRGLGRAAPRARICGWLRSGVGAGTWARLL